MRVDPARNAPESRRGATLIETAFAVSLLVVVAGAMASISSTGSSLFRSNVVNAEVDAAARRTLQIISEELLRTGTTVVTPLAVTTNTGSDDVDYQHAVGVVGTTVQWGNPSSIELEMERGEVDDGLDNDGDGLVDERQVVLIRNPGAVDQQRRVLCSGVGEMLAGEVDDNDDDNGNGLVDEAGLSFHLVGDVMEVRLTLQRMDKDGRLVERTLETAVRLRN